MQKISRRDLIEWGVAFATAGLSVDSSADGLPDPLTRRSKNPRPWVAERVAEKLTPLPFEAQQLSGPLAERMRINVEGRLLHIDEKAFLSPFLQRDSAGSFDAAWAGEHAGKFLDAACNALRYQENQNLRRSASRIAGTLVSRQEPDGYAGTYPAARRWTGWDVWIHKYNLIGLLSYYELTTDAGVLNACRAMGDLLVRTFGDAPGQRDIIQAGEHVGMAATSVLEPMCKLYRFTGDPRHLEFCKYIVRAYDRPGGPRIVATLLRSGSVYATANGKAYEMLSNLNGLVDLYRLTADERLLQAVLRAWDDIVQHQLYRTGTVSAMEHFQPNGRLLSLPSSNVGETCATVTWLQLNWRLFRLTGEARYGQEIERTVYNHLLAAQDLRKGDICYYTAWVGEKEFTDAVLCCVSSGPRGISLIPQLVWGLTADALVVNLYTSGHARFEINGVPVQVTSDTSFPAKGEVALSVDPQRPTRFTVRLRVPEWATEFEVSTGTRTLKGVPGQMLDVAATWPGKLHVRMDLPTRVGVGDPTYPDYALLQRGPQVLALERSLNPTVRYLNRVVLTDNTSVAEVTTKRGEWHGPQVYGIEAMVGVPTSTAGADRLRAETGALSSAAGTLHFERRTLRFEKRTLRVVPFSDTVDGSVWMTKAGKGRRDQPAVTAFARTGLSVVALHLEPTAGRPVATDIAEFVTDENPDTYCTVNPEDPGLADYLGAPRGKRGDPVWFSVRLKSAATISRVVFRHGASSASGGWFDTTAGLPRIEVAKTPIPTSSNAAIAEDSKVSWELIAVLEGYPRTTAATSPALSNAQLFEVRLPEPVSVYGIRVIGKPGGDHASCAELSAYA